VPSARVDPSSLVRIAEALAVRGEADSPAQALRDAADSDPKGLSPGLAVRIAEMAREFDPPTALRAVRRALEAPDLHTAKRARLQQLVEELIADGPGTGRSLPAEAPATSPRPSTTSLAASDELGELEAATTDPLLNGPEAGLDRIVERELGAELESGAEAMEIKPDAEIEALALTSRFRDLKSREAMPTGLLTEAVALQVAAGRTARIAYTRIEAIAVAEVMGLARYPVVVIDLLLNWSSQRDRSLRAIRLRSDGFDPRMVFEAPADRDEALRGFLSELLARCNAVPLPDLASIRGLDVRTFETAEAYARDVLQLES
jgi:hypothetical protein